MKPAVSRQSVLHFKILIEQDEDGWFVASVPELPGCYTQGKTVEQARNRIRQVIKLVLDTEPEITQEKKRFPESFPKFFGIEDLIFPYA
ncbi:hypothetical protein A2W24_04955 [Microgenomates group bacterium RBG_16_45_19]|nr:MAG: hypothetical protein A2W24_04955 [Microgenomates group bacterium RBG_16_45_19]